MSEQRTRRAAPGLTPLQSSDGRNAMPLHWHLLSAAVIAILATAFLAVLDARRGADAPQAMVRRAETARDVAAARATDRLPVAAAAVASPAPVVSNLAPLPVWTPSLRPVLPVEPSPPTQVVAAEPPAVELRPVAPAPVVPDASPPAAQQPAPTEAGSPTRLTAVPPPSEPAETSSIETGVAHPLPPTRPDRSGVAPGVIASAQTPTQCLSEELRNVLADVAERFGPVTLMSTTHLHTDNHSPGSARAKMHANCKAVDFKSGKNVKEVLAFLRTRKEVGGINSYRNGVIHIDANPAYRVATQPARATPGAKPRKGSRKKPSGRKRRR